MARKPESELQITQAPHDAFVRVQRIAWVVLVCAVIAVLLGVFGGQGLVSNARVRTADGALEIHYDRLSRLSAPASLEVRVAGSSVGAQELRLGLDREYLKAAQIERVTPVPVRVEAGAQQLVYVFAASPGTPALIVFHMKMDAIGFERARVTLAPDRALEFTQLIYP